MAISITIVRITLMSICRNIPEHKRIAAVHGSLIDYKYGAKSRRRFPAVLLVMDRFKC